MLQPKLEYYRKHDMYTVNRKTACTRVTGVPHVHGYTGTHLLCPRLALIVHEAQAGNHCNKDREVDHFGGISINVDAEIKVELVQFLRKIVEEVVQTTSIVLVGLLC